jgi:hypothetical protein
MAKVLLEVNSMVDPPQFSHLGHHLINKNGIGRFGRNEMDPPLCGLAAMSHNEFKISEPIEPQEASPMEKKLRVVGIDIATQVLHLVGMDEHGTMLVRKRLYRAPVMACIAQRPPPLMGMAACGGAHDWARRFRAHGHAVTRMAPQFVKPYVKANKNAMRDAEAIAEAVTRPTMRFVPTKGVDQQDRQALHRVRARFMASTSSGRR